jgi:hypothetical protein
LRCYSVKRSGVCVYLNKKTLTHWSEEAEETFNRQPLNVDAHKTGNLKNTYVLVEVKTCPDLVVTVPVSIYVFSVLLLLKFQKSFKLKLPLVVFDKNTFIVL